MFVGCSKQDTTIADNYGGGNYSLEGNHYIEDISYHVNKAYIGAKPKMIMEIKGDSLIQRWPANNSWQIDEHNYNIEKYIRLD